MNRPPLTPAQEQILYVYHGVSKGAQEPDSSLREIGSGFIDGKKVIPERKSKGSTYKLVKTLVKRIRYSKVLEKRTLLGC